MKRILVIFFILFLCIPLSSCKGSGKTDNAEINYGNSIKFSETEIKAAVDVVLIEFRELKGGNLKKIWYDEEASDSEVSEYLSTGKGSVNGANIENVIILFSIYSTNGGADRNSKWILIRDNKNSEWIVDDSGY